MNDDFYYMRLPEVRKKTGLARSTIYQLRSKGRFPSPQKLGPRMSAWKSTDIHAWMENPTTWRPDQHEN